MTIYGHYLIITIRLHSISRTYQEDEPGSRNLVAAQTRRFTWFVMNRDPEQSLRWLIRAMSKPCQLLSRHNKARNIMRHLKTRLLIDIDQRLQAHQTQFK